MAGLAGGARRRCSAGVWQRWGVYPAGGGGRDGGGVTGAAVAQATGAAWVAGCGRPVGSRRWWCHLVGDDGDGRKWAVVGDGSCVEATVAAITWTADGTG